MKKFLPAVCVALVWLVTLPSGAVEHPKDLIDRPTGGTSAVVASGGMTHVANIPYTTGSDLEFATIGGRDYVFAGAYSTSPTGGVRVIDITNPEAPALVAIVPCRINQNDVQIRGTTLVMASDSGGNCTRANGTTVSFTGFATADISNPASPKVIGVAQIRQGAHNLTIHPTQPLVYVSNSDIVGPAVVHIWDIADPANPALVKNWSYFPQSPPHDITFNAAGTRAYSASITHTDIFDTTDPRNPTLITTFADPAINIAHQADPTPDGRYLLITDEVAGALTGPVCPGGGVHVFDISNELAPVPVGVFWADPAGRSTLCTAHVFRINPDGKTMAIAWYNAGVHVFDISSLFVGAGGSGAVTGVGVRTLGSMKMANADTWSAKMWPERHPGYVFANDIARGFDIFKLSS